MKILMLTTHLRIGGIAVYVTSLAKALTKRGDRVIAVSSGGDMTDELTKAGISHIELDIQMAQQQWFGVTRFYPL